MDIVSGSRPWWKSFQLALGCSCIALIVLWNVPSIPILLKVFSMKWCWILLNAFSAFIDIIIWFLFFNLLMWYITLICIYWAVLHRKDESYLVLENDLFAVLLDSLAYYFAEDFCIYVLQGYRSIILSLLCLYLALLSRWWWHHRRNLEGLPPFLLFWIDRWWRIREDLLETFGRIQQW